MFKYINIYLYTHTRARASALTKFWFNYRLAPPFFTYFVKKNLTQLYVYIAGALLWLSENHYVTKSFL